jgi:hypothetical protein
MFSKVISATLLGFQNLTGFILVAIDGESRKHPLSLPVSGI